ncbi:MAG: hypothetical protein C4339_01565 [Nitrososphaerota archaeon]
MAEELASAVRSPRSSLARSFSSESRSSALLRGLSSLITRPRARWMPQRATRMSAQSPCS